MPPYGFRKCACFLSRNALPALCMPIVLPPHLAYVTRPARDHIAKKEMETFEHDPWKAQDAVRSLFDEALRSDTVALDEVADRRDISPQKLR